VSPYRPSVELTAQQRLRLARHIDDLAALFVEVRLRNR
jgi:hypothetical protein